MPSGCFDFFTSFLIGLESVSVKCVFVDMHVFVSGLFYISVMNMRLGLAVTLEPQTSVCVLKPLCMHFLRSGQRGLLRLFQAKWVMKG